MAKPDRRIPRATFFNRVKTPAGKVVKRKLIIRRRNRRARERPGDA